MFGGGLNWKLLGLGMLIGVGIIIVDELLRHFTKRASLPPLAVGMGMYLPIDLTLMIPVGAVLGLIWDRWSSRQANPERAKRLGTLLATGLIVGESLWGVVFAGIVAATGKESPLAVVGDSFENIANILGIILFAVVVLGLYQWTRRMVTAADRLRATHE